jgi:hypothetical protein
VAVPIVVVVIAGVLAALVVLPGYVRRHPRLRGSGGGGAGLFGVADEIYNPSALDGRGALDEESRLIVLAPSPDGDKGIGDGRIRIRIRLDS